MTIKTPAVHVGGYCGLVVRCKLIVNLEAMLGITHSEALADDGSL